MEKSVRYFLPALVGCLLVVGSTVQAQTRGTTKIQPRFFNPFAVAGSSQLGTNPFGGPDLSAFSSSVVNPFAGEEEVATTAGSVVTSESSVSVPVVAASSGRPSYRPPVRSPYRPPPRPSF